MWRVAGCDASCYCRVIRKPAGMKYTRVLSMAPHEPHTGRYMSSAPWSSTSQYFISVLFFFLNILFNSYFFLFAVLHLFMCIKSYFSPKFVYCHVFAITSATQLFTSFTSHSNNEFSPSITITSQFPIFISHFTYLLEFLSRPWQPYNLPHFLTSFKF